MIERQCWMCESFEADPLHPERGTCEQLADLCLQENGVRATCVVSQSQSAERCDGFELTNAAYAEMDADGLIHETWQERMTQALNL